MRIPSSFILRFRRPFAHDEARETTCYPVEAEIQLSAELKVNPVVLRS